MMGLVGGPLLLGGLGPVCVIYMCDIQWTLDSVCLRF